MPPSALDQRLTAAELLADAQAALAAELERGLTAHGAHGLGAQTFEVLSRLARAPGGRLRMTDLAAQVALSPSGLTRAVDRLVAEGLVERVACPSDRRGAFAALTPRGRSRLEAALPTRDQVLEQCFGGVLDSAELAQLASLLRRLRDHVDPEGSCENR